MNQIRRNWNHIFNGPSRQSRGATATLTSVFRSHQPSLLPHTSPESLGSHPCRQPSLSGSQLETVTTVKQGRCPRRAAQREDFKDGSRTKRKAPETGTPRGQSWERGADCPRPGEAAAAAGPAPEDGQPRQEPAPRREEAAGPEQRGNWGERRPHPQLPPPGSPTAAAHWLRRAETREPRSPRLRPRGARRARGAAEGSRREEGKTLSRIFFEACIFLLMTLSC